MTNQDPDKDLLAFTKRELDHSLQHLDSHTVSRLQQARHRALQGQPHQSPWFWPASGLAAVCTVLLAVFFLVSSPVELPPIQTFEDLEVLASTETLDLYEDLEFYGWLAERDPSS